ncbi:hypothetical protein ABK040_004902 [Willaertia magna]
MTKEKVTIHSRVDNYPIQAYLFYNKEEEQPSNNDTNHQTHIATTIDSGNNNNDNTLELNIVENQSINITSSGISDVNKKANKIIFVIISGATGVVQQYYSSFAEYLISKNNDEKIFVVTYDYRGIGQSKPKSLKDLNCNITDWGTKDFLGVIDFVNNFHKTNYENSQLEIIVIGHSVGGHILAMVPEEISKQIKRIVLFSCVNAYFGYFTHYLRSWSDFSTFCAQLTFFNSLPLLTALYGYFPAKKVFGSMEDLPKGVAKQWNYFCNHPEYLVDERGQLILPKGLENTDILSLAFEDDTFTNKNSIDKMNEKFMTRSKSFNCVIVPRFDKVVIGHVGFFKKNVRDRTTLWKDVKDYILKGETQLLNPKFKTSKL